MHVCIAIQAFDADMDELEDMFLKCSQRINLRQTLDMKQVHSPPFIYTSRLERYVEFDRCCWTIRGRIEAIKCLYIKCRCSHCLQQIKSFDISNPLTYDNKCKKCRHNLIMQASWEGVVLVDDGTSVCQLRCDDDVILMILKIFAGAAVDLMEKFIHMTEANVKTTGYIKVDTFQLTRMKGLKRRVGFDEFIDELDESENDLSGIVVDELEEKDILDDPVKRQLAAIMLRRGRFVDDNMNFIVQIMHSADGKNDTSHRYESNSSLFENIIP